MSLRHRIPAIVNALWLVPFATGLLHADILRWDTGELITTRSLESALDRHIDLSYANLSNQVLIGLDADDATLDHARFDGSQIHACSFEEASLEGASFMSCVISSSSFSEAELEEASFNWSQISGTDLGRIVAPGSHFEGCSISSCDLNRAELQGADFSSCSLSGLNLGRIEAEGSIFDHASLSQSTFSRSNLNGASLVGFHVSGTGMDRMELEDCDWSDGSLSNSDLTDSNLQHARLAGFHLDGSVGWNHAEFDDACYSLDSTFPAWFDCEQENMVICTGGVVGAEHEPAELAITNIWPNPFNPATTIRFRLEDPAPASLRLYNILGREMAVLMAGQQDRGTMEVVLDGSGLASGTYLLVLEQEGKRDVRSILLMK